MKLQLINSPISDDNLFEHFGLVCVYIQANASMVRMRVGIVVSYVQV